MSNALTSVTSNDSTARFQSCQHPKSDTYSVSNITNAPPMSGEKWNFNNCTVTINNQNSQVNKQKRKYNVIYESDSQSQ